MIERDLRNAPNKEWFATQDDLNVSKKIEFYHDTQLIEGLAHRQEVFWLLRQRKKNTLQLQYISFIERISLDLEIGITEKIAEDLRSKKQINKADISIACDWFKEHFLLENKNKKDRLVIAYFKNTEDNQFLAIGDEWQAHISREDNIVIIQKFTRLNTKDVKLSVIEGVVEFYDAGINQRILDPVQKQLLDASLRDNGSYLELWRLYNDLQWTKASQYASEVGALRFLRKEAVDADQLAWRFFAENTEILNEFRNKWQSLDLVGAHVEVTDNAPHWSTDEDYQSTNSKVFRGELSFEKESVIITPDEKRRNEAPPSNGYIAYSLAGEIAVRKRREQARLAIDKGQRLPQLSHLLQGLAVPVPPHRKLKALTSYAKDTFKGGKPTDRQIQALDISLNTPDIALVIGPPGTGKTQVIAALQRRLVEENPDDGGIEHQVLISSYQHDAVDNALNRSDVYGLPAIRVGGRNNKKNDTKPITFWCEARRKNIFEALEKKRKEEPHVILLEGLQRILTEFKLSPMTPVLRAEKFQQLMDILEQLEEMGITLSSDVQYDWNQFFKSSNKGIKQENLLSNNNNLLIKTRALRVTKTSFSDDGMDRAYDLVSLLHRKKISLPKEDKKLLKNLSNEIEITELQATQIKQLRNKLLDHFIPDYRPPEIKNILTKEGVNILNKIENSLDNSLSQSRKGISGVLKRYYDALAYSPKEAERAVESYSAIIGATCQQSASKQMSALQSLSNLDAQTEIEFETVIIDEAARANPLDLFVPMAMAKRRIILVGDDRQLPHLLEPELEQELAEQENLTDSQRTAYKQSLFERLRLQLLKIEKETGQRRVVMLDTQFRMHPILGDFISKNFYENEGLDVLKSGRPAEDFIHSTSKYAGKVCAWLNVPISEGKESRRKSSRIRKAEAEAIAREGKRLLEATNDTVSIGIITFYSAQRDLIFEEMSHIGVVEQGNIIPEYLYTNEGEERLRIGTVDAFQGKEFDIVLLSIVRANTITLSSNLETQKKEAALNRKYGHLRLSNRMNVAMSRQRKLLIAVGALDMAHTDEAIDAIPALYNFLTLCRGEHGKIL